MMNSPLHHLFRSRPMWQRPYSTSPPTALAMKPGTPIPGMDSIYPKPDPKKPTDPDKTPPVAKSREEYPKWVNNLAKPLPTLAYLRSIKIEEGTDYEMRRYLKLVRRIQIKENNSVAGL
eukprot:scaffold10872_cov66-Cyclotella_meneghiniana.AAC.7